MENVIIPAYDRTKLASYLKKYSPQHVCLTPAYYEDLIIWLEGLVVRFGLDINPEIFHNPKFDINNLYTMAQSFFTIEGTSDILNTTLGVTSTLISGVSNLVLGFIIAIYVSLNLWYIC